MMIGPFFQASQFLPPSLIRLVLSCLTGIIISFRTWPLSLAVAGLPKEEGVSFMKYLRCCMNLFTLGRSMM